MNGGYDDGYKACPCFWGREPGSYVKLLTKYVPSMLNLKALDAGCGEGKNAAFLAESGALVDAVDISSFAIQNGKRTWPELTGIHWILADASTATLPQSLYDIVVAYGFMHCLSTPQEIERVLGTLKSATGEGGHLVLCAFNNRSQDLSAHPGFEPTLIGHDRYLQEFSDWAVLEHSDTDLTETHPHNKIEHTHSMTRIIARKPR